MVIIQLALLAYIVAILGVILMSWFPISPESPAYSIFVTLRRVTNPVLEPVRRVIPPVGGVLDLSPMIVLFVLTTILRIIS